MRRINKLVFIFVVSLLIIGCDPSLKPENFRFNPDIIGQSIYNYSKDCLEKDEYIYSTVFNKKYDEIYDELKIQDIRSFAFSDIMLTAHPNGKIYEAVYSAQADFFTDEDFLKLVQLYDSSITTDDVKFRHDSPSGCPGYKYSATLEKEYGDCTLTIRYSRGYRYMWINEGYYSSIYVTIRETATI